MTRPGQDSGTSLKSVALAFAALLSVFIVTHALKFPGSIAYLMEITQGQKILDMQASSTSDETYRRLEAFGELGRRTYLRTILTVDFVFPVSAFIFLFLLARFASQKLGMKPPLSWALRSLSIAYAAFDLIENAIVLTLLSKFPERLEFLASCIGAFTRAKRFSMFAALLVPIALLAGAKLYSLSAKPKIIDSPSGFNPPS